MNGDTAEERFDLARRLWKDGDWLELERLAATNSLEPLGKDDATLILLAAAALAQRGAFKEMRSHVTRAEAIGATRSLVAKILLGSLQNTMGRLAVLQDDAHRAETWFAASVSAVGLKDDGKIRRLRETARMGLLSEASELVEESYQASLPRFSSAEAAMLRVQIDLLNHELVQALERKQLHRPEYGEAGSDPAARSVAQLGQDLWVLAQTGMKRKGYFVEFGATDGVLLSNTWLLERDFGWDGLCAEPNPEFFAKLQRNRACSVAPDCIYGQSGERVEFILADEYGGIAQHALEDKHSNKRTPFRLTGRVLTLESISLNDFLKKYGAPRRIDYMSIDTEGSEWEILRHFPLADWDVALLTIEHNFTPEREKIRELLEGHGYVRTEMKWDDWYARPDLLPAAEADPAGTGSGPSVGGQNV